MKRVVNLFTLLVFLCTSFFALFSYAQMESPEAKETPENVVENTGESETISENNVENPESEVSVEPENIEDQVVQNDEISEQDSQLQMIQEPVIMILEQGTTATLLPGTGFNSAIKTLANGGVETEYTSVDNNIESFQRVDKVPAGVTTGEISLAGEEYPVYAWFDGGILYYATRAEIIHLNENSQQMFYNFSGLTELDLSDFDTSDVTNMYGIFAGCSQLGELNLNGWDFSNTSVNMMNMTYGGLPLLKKMDMQNTKFSGSLASAFAGLSGLIEINLSGVNTEGVTNMGGMFASCSSLTGLNLSNWDTSNVTSMGGMFNGCNKLEELNLSGWDFRKAISNGLIMNLFSSDHYMYDQIKKLDLTNSKFTGSMGSAFMHMDSLEEINLNGVDTKGVTNMSQMFMFDDKLTTLDLSSFDTSNVTNMHYMFYYCNGLTTLDLSNFDTSNITGSLGLDGMFNSCRHLEDLNLSGWIFNNGNGVNLIYKLFSGSPSQLKKLNLSNTVFTGSMASAFRDLKNLKVIKLDGIDTKGVINMENMFAWSSSLTGLDLSDVDTSNVTSMGGMFQGCTGLINLDLSNWDTSNVTNIGNIFTSCGSLENLNLDNWDMSKVTGYGGMFGSTNSLKKLSARNWVIPEKFTNMLGCSDTQLCVSGLLMDVSNWDLSKTKDLSRLFVNSKAKEIKGLDTWDTSSVTGMYYMFGYCSNITGLDLSNWDTSNVTSMSAMFYNALNLKTIYASDKFVTTSVTDNGGGMFDGTISIVGGNGTKYNSSYRDKTYAKIDKSGQKGYFTEKGQDIVVRFMVGKKEYITQTVQFGGKVSRPTNDPVKTGAEFVGWTTEYGEEYDFGTNIERYTELYAKFSGGNETILLPGKDFNQIIKKLSGQTGATYSTNNTGIIKILQWTGDIPLGVTTGRISTIDSANEVVARYDDGVIYYHTDAAKIYLNEDSSYMFYVMRSLTRIDMDKWDTSNVENMEYMFYDCGLTELDLSSRNTNSVTSMYYMFGDTYLTTLNLEGWDTSNVENMECMFYYSYYLTDLNMSGRDFRNVNHSLYYIRYYYPFYYGGKLNLTNAKFAGDINYIFYYLGNGYGNVEEIILDGVDTSEVTSMKEVFYGLDKVKELDLSSWDTSNVTNMDGMFEYCNDLEIIYVSTGFVTNQVTSSSGMFLGDTKLVGGNGTVFDSNYTDKEYARIDGKNGLSGYFTSIITLNFDTNGGTLVDSQTFKAGLTGTKPTDPTKTGNTFLGWFMSDDLEFDFSQPIFEPTQLYAKWQINQYTITFDTDGGDVMNSIDVNYGDNISVPNPTRNGHRFIRWEPSLPATMPAENLAVKAIWERNGSSGGGGGGGGGGGSSSSSSTGSNTPDVTPNQQSGTGTNNSTGTQNEQTTTGTIVNEPEGTGNNTEIQTGSVVEPSEESPQDSNTDTPNNNTEGQNNSQGNSTYSTEFQQAYEFAKGNGITTMPTIQKANMEGKLTRIAMAKMLSQYAVNVLGKEPDLSKGTVKFNDVTNNMDKDYDNGVTLAYQLGIMGQNMPGNNFRPNDEVTRGEFATALSRMAYGTSDGEYKGTGKYYIHHMEKLVKEGIITKDDPNMKELRGYVMVMLMRSTK